MLGEKIKKFLSFENNSNIFYLSVPSRPVVPKLFRCADHLESFGGPRSTKY